MSQSVGPLLIALGLLLVVVGLLFWAGLLDWFGRLPGDIRIERGNTHVFFPITSMLVVSGVLSLIIHLIRRFFG